MNSVKIFDCLNHFPFDDQELEKIVKRSWLTSNMISLFKSKWKKVIPKDQVQHEFEEYKKKDFFFKISEDYLSFLKEFGDTASKGRLFQDPLFDQTFLDCELYFLVNIIHDDYMVIDVVKLKNKSKYWTVDSLKSFIQGHNMSKEYLIEEAISMNNFLFKESSEDYDINFNQLANQKLMELKNRSDQ